MAWKPGTPVTLANTNVRQQLSTTAQLVKAIRVFPAVNGGHTIYIGDSTLDPTQLPITGLLGWVPAVPASPAVYPYVEGYESQSVNGINAEAVFVAGTAPDVVYWSFIEQ